MNRASQFSEESLNSWSAHAEWHPIPLNRSASYVAQHCNVSLDRFSRTNARICDQGRSGRGILASALLGGIVAMRIAFVAKSPMRSELAERRKAHGGVGLWFAACFGYWIWPM
jgi:hypothetical protein